VPLVGRQTEVNELECGLGAAREGHGELVLVVGEAGVGKTRLVQDVLARSGSLVLAGAATQEVTSPYEPLVAALRAATRTAPDSFAAGCGPLAAHLAPLLPELGPAPESSDRPTLFEALRCVLESVARANPGVVLFLDDLQWADDATLELLPALAGWLARTPLLVLGAYRNDELSRGHPIRRLRTQLRRAGQLRELLVPPLDPQQTAQLAGHVLGALPSPNLALNLFDRTQGVPFFVEELAAALAVGGRLRAGAGGLELATDADDLPIPETVRDAVLLRTDGLSEEARTAFELAAVVGLRFDLELIEAMLPGGAQALEQARERGLIVELADQRGRAAFRHTLVREALYADIPWTRRLSLHYTLAERLARQGARPDILAEHWLAAREPDAARLALVAAAEAACAVHAYRDGARAAQRAIELWPVGEDEASRLGVFDQLGHAAELSGNLPEAARAWRDLADGRRGCGDLGGAAEAERHLACVYEVQGAWDRALSLRLAAAQDFAACQRVADAAAERLAAATHLLRSGGYVVAQELVVTALAEADLAGRDDLRARALALEGALRAKQGQLDTGVAGLRTALTYALDRNLVGPAAQAYRDLAGVFERGADYRRAGDVYATALDFCSSRGVSGEALICLGCLGYIQRQIGEWDRAFQVCRDVIASPESPRDARMVAACISAWILAMRGDARRAPGALVDALAQAQRAGNATFELECLWALGSMEQPAGDRGAGAERSRAILHRWRGSGVLHYAISPLRWATTASAAAGEPALARACAGALAEIAAAVGHPEALAALAHALGELSMLEGDPYAAASQFGQALDLLGEVEIPYERAQTQLCCCNSVTNSTAPALGP